MTANSGVKEEERFSLHVIVNDGGQEKMVPAPPEGIVKGLLDEVVNVAFWETQAQPKEGKRQGQVLVVGGKAYECKGTPNTTYSVYDNATQREYLRINHEVRQRILLGKKTGVLDKWVQGQPMTPAKNVAPDALYKMGARRLDEVYDQDLMPQVLARLQGTSASEEPTPKGGDKPSSG